MAKDNRDPELLAVELNSNRRMGETLSQVADRLSGVVVPDHGTDAAVEWRSKLNGHLQAANEAFKPR